MKKTLLFFFLLYCLPLGSAAQFACAGLDRVDIYLNGKLKGSATAADVPTVRLDTISKPDTLLFHAFTNFEGLRNSTVDVKDDFGELLDHINSTNNTGYEATFTYVFDRSTLDDPSVKSCDVFIHLLCERDVSTEQLCTLSLNAESPQANKVSKH